MLDPLLAGVLRQFHNEILDLKKMVEEVRSAIDEIKESVSMELELASTSSDSDEESVASANTI